MKGVNMNHNYEIIKALHNRVMTQEDLGTCTGIHYSTISRIITGRAVPTAKERRKLSRFFRIPQYILFGGNNVRKPNPENSSPVPEKTS